MQLNQIIQLDIIDMTDEGSAVGKIDNITVFVENAVIGDTVRAKITKIKKNYMTAEVLEIINPSSIRNIKKLCNIQDVCGGCQILDIKYEEQLKIKENLVRQKLIRLGNIQAPNISEIISMENPFRYRNKTQMPVCVKDNEIQIGFYKQKSHEIVPFTDCLIQDDINNKIIQIIKKFIKKENISIYDEKNHIGNLRHIITKISKSKNQIMLILVTNKKERLDIDHLINEFKLNNINISSIIQNINSKKTNVILSNQNIILYGKDYIEDIIEDLVFRIYPNSFYQVNSIQMEKMYNQALIYADLKGDETVYDLYCGIGTISLLFAKRCKQVYGIEVVSQAIESAKQNAKINNIQNVKFICSKVEDSIKQVVKQSQKPDIIILDPARKGCDEKVLQTILEVKPKKIIYISCNPSTLARDLKTLMQYSNYKIDDIKLFDLFCHTMHVETICYLSLKY